MDAGVISILGPAAGIILGLALGFYAATRKES